MGRLRCVATSPATVWPLLVAAVWLLPGVYPQLLTLALWLGVAIAFPLVVRMSTWDPLEGAEVSRRLQGELDVLAGELRVAAPQVRVVDDLASGASLEKWKGPGYVVVDRKVAGGDAGERHAILAHELAHLRVDRSPYWAVAGLLAAGVLAATPFGWWSLLTGVAVAEVAVLWGFRSSRQSEFAADELVVRTFPHLRRPLITALAGDTGEPLPREQVPLLGTHPPVSDRVERILAAP